MAGTIPVVYSDGWLPPFNKKVVDWDKCAVFVPEAKCKQTLDVLREMPRDVICEMQKCAIDTWDKYVAQRSGWLRGILESLP